MNTQQNFESLFSRLDALESRLCKEISNTTKELEALSNIIRHNSKSYVGECEHSDQAEGEGCSGKKKRNTQDMPSDSAPGVDMAPSKNLLKRLKRGYLLQYESDGNDPVERTVNSRSIDFIDMVKREACPKTACGRYCTVVINIALSNCIAHALLHQPILLIHSSNLIRPA